MTPTTLPTRRYKLASELTDDERAQARAFGSDGRVERDEYVAARRRLLAEGVDDPRLELRLLEEEAEALRVDAAERESRALEAVTVEQWNTEITGGERPKLAGAEKVAKARQEADAMEHRARELEQHLEIERLESVTVQDHLDSIRGGR